VGLSPFIYWLKPAKVIEGSTATNGYNQAKKNNAEGFFEPYFVGRSGYSILSDVFVVMRHKTSDVFEFGEIGITSDGIARHCYVGDICCLDKNWT
jgi:hypothetical protein